MKKIEVIVKSDKLEEIKKVLEEIDIHDMFITNVMRYSKDKGYTQIYRGKAYTVEFVPRIKIEIVISDGWYTATKNAIIAAIKTSDRDDEKIFTYDIKESISI